MPTGEEESPQTSRSCPFASQTSKRILQQPAGRPPMHIQGYHNFVRMSLFYLMEECIHHHIKKSVTNFRKPQEVGLKLEIMLRHLATGETHTPPSSITGWLAKPSYVNSSPRSAEPSLLNSRTNICSTQLALRTLKRYRRSSEPDGVSPMLLGPEKGSISP